MTSLADGSPARLEQRIAELEEKLQRERARYQQLKEATWCVPGDVLGLQKILDQVGHEITLATATEQSRAMEGLLQQVDINQELLETGGKNQVRLDKVTELLRDLYGEIRSWPMEFHHQERLCDVAQVFSVLREALTVLETEPPQFSPAEPVGQAQEMARRCALWLESRLQAWAQSAHVESTLLPGEVQVSHLLQMCQQMRKSYRQLSVSKLHRWLGFIQGAMVCQGLTTVARERVGYRLIKAGLQQGRTAEEILK